MEGAISEETSVEIIIEMGAFDQNVRVEKSGGQTMQALISEMQAGGKEWERELHLLR